MRYRQVDTRISGIENGEFLNSKVPVERIDEENRYFTEERSFGEMLNEEDMFPEYFLLG